MSYKKIPVVIVVAMSRERRAIGAGSRLLWHIPEDLKRFKELTREMPVIMGRKTFESIVNILGKPLPNRSNIVVTRNPEYAYEGVEVAGSLEAALAVAAEHEPTEIHIGGGGELYRQALPYVDRIHATFVDDEPAAADVFFPDFTSEFKIETEYLSAEHNGITYQFVDYTRS